MVSTQPYVIQYVACWHATVCTYDGVGSNVHYVRLSSANRTPHAIGSAATANWRPVPCPSAGLARSTDLEPVHHNTAYSRRGSVA